MKISAISNLYKPYNLKKCSPTSFKSIYDVDFFIRSETVEKKPDYRDFKFDHTKKFGIEDYKSLTPRQIENIKENPKVAAMRDKAEDSIICAQELKNSLDEKYGEGNYVFECVGNSPAGIGRVMEFMGVETHYIPISNISSISENFLLKDINSNEKGKKAYREYLSSQGVKPDMTYDNKKHFLFFDYTCSGYSLMNFQTILEKCFDIPSSENIEYKSLNDELYEIDFDNKKPSFVRNYISNELVFSSVEVYSGVPHLNFRVLDEISSNKPLSSSYSPEFNFCVIDKLKSDGLLKENPLNKCNKF